MRNEYCEELFGLGYVFDIVNCENVESRKNKYRKRRENMHSKDKGKPCFPRFSKP